MRSGFVAHHSERNKNIRVEIVLGRNSGLAAGRYSLFRRDLSLTAKRRPTGKSLKCLSSPIRKNIPPFHRTQITGLFPPSHPSEGRIAIVTDAGWDAVDADGAVDERA